MQKLTVKDITIFITKNGVLWQRVGQPPFAMKEDEIIPVVNATAELYKAVLKSQSDELDEREAELKEKLQDKE